MLCPVCFGRGWWYRRICPECNGVGIIHCCEGEVAQPPPDGSAEQTCRSASVDQPTDRPSPTS